MIVQKILAMYKASRCFLYCAQEYCKHAVRNWSDNEAIPNIINELITTEGFYIDTAEDEDSGLSIVSWIREISPLPHSLNKVLNKVISATVIPNEGPLLKTLNLVMSFR